MDINKENLIKHGYTQHDCSSLIHEHASAFFQKKIHDEKGVYYFINVYEYNFEQFSNVHRDIKYTIDMQFNKNEQYFNVEFEPKSIYDIESIANEFFNNMKFDMHEKY